MDANVVTAPLRRGGPTISPLEMVVTLLDANVVTVPLRGGGPTVSPWEIVVTLCCHTQKDPAV